MMDEEKTEETTIALSESSPEPQEENLSEKKVEVEASELREVLQELRLVNQNLATLQQALIVEEQEVDQIEDKLESAAEPEIAHDQPQAAETTVAEEIVVVQEAPKEEAKRGRKPGWWRFL